MGLSNQAGRYKKEYVNDFPDRKIHPINCVPDDRPHGSWTNGVKAWKRGDSGSSDTVVGWFFPPRHRNKGWKTRKSRSISLPQDVQEQLIHDAGYPVLEEE